MVFTIWQLYVDRIVYACCDFNPWPIIAHQCKTCPIDFPFRCMQGDTTTRSCTHEFAVCTNREGRSEERPINSVWMIDRIMKMIKAKMTGSRQMSYCNFISMLHQNHSPSVLAPLTTVLPRKGNLSEVLCKPKIMPIKSLGTRGLTTDEKQDLSSGTFLCHVPVTSCDPNTSIDVTSLIQLSVLFCPETSEVWSFWKEPSHVPKFG